MQIRPYRPSDLPALASLDAACFPPPFRFSQRTMRACAERPGALARLATEQGTIAAQEQLLGFAIAHLQPVADEVSVYLVTLDVAAEARRRGIGRALLGALEREAAHLGATMAHLHVFAGNQQALALYAHLGYERFGREGGYYGPGLDALLYRKPLPRTT